eukprot:TRINITY_DN3047_c0_g1_i1.p1 TRINITY_DN3047_c0_g1~~TRINITY_DN3047_c0_g1_i1.p1  ORF type:complete len:432 (-),score=75.11 TRINITY_DN3047_c0_g1_i1:895-2190(-)
MVSTQSTGCHAETTKGYIYTIKMDFTTVSYVCAGVVVVAGLLYHFSGAQKKPRDVYGVLGEASEDCSPIVRNFRERDLITTFGDCVTIHDLFKNSRKNNPNKPFFGTRKQLQVITEKKIIKGVEKSWQYFQLSPFEWETYEQIGKRVDNFSSGLINLGVRRGGNIALYSDTRAEWHIASLSSFAQNIVVLTVYANLGIEPMIHAFNEGEISTIVTNAALVKGLEAVLGKVSSLKCIIYTDTITDQQKQKFIDRGIQLIKFEDVEKIGSENPIPPNPAPDSSSLAVIMYTSGTTGNPKGVMLTHQNVLSTMASAFKVLNLKDEVHLSYLPLAHILAFVVDTAMMAIGATMGFGNPRSLSTSAVRACKGDLEELRPTLFVGVPSVHDRIKQGIQSQIDQGNSFTKSLFKFAYETKKKSTHSRQRYTFTQSNNI